MQTQGSPATMPTIRLAFWLTLLCPTLPCLAQTSLPLFGLLPGNHTREQVQQVVQAQQARITGEFYGNAQDAFLAIRPENIPNKRVIVMHVEGMPDSGTAHLQMAFLDETLYQIRFDYPPGTPTDPTYQDLTRRYGQAAGHSSSQASAYSWPQGAYTVTLQKQLAGSYALIWQHNALARQVATSNTEAYAAHIRNKRRTTGTFP